MKKLSLILLLFLLIPSVCWGQLASKDIELNITRKLYTVKLGVDNDDVEIGDGESLTSLNPQVKFFRWNKENSLGIKFIGLNAPSTFDTQTKTLEIKNSKIGFYFNKVDDTNLKFGLIFYEKPLINTWDFQLEGWEDFDFYYQPALTQEEIDKGSIRPDNVVGSYAVYHKTKRNHEVGKTNYKTGKAFHIYRPKFIDANNNWVWGDLHIEIENGVYIITVPQDFLNNAVYPIKANDIIGDNDGGASGDASWGQCAVQANLPVNGDISGISIQCLDTTVPPYLELRGAIWDDVSTYPTNREVLGATITIPSVQNYVESVVSPPVALTAADLWIGGSNDKSSSTTIYYDSSTPVSSYEIDSTEKYPPTDPFAAGGTLRSGRRYAVYATYTPAAGGVVDDGQVFIISKLNE